jgi:deoxyribose-phosphate aldolase
MQAISLGAKAVCTNPYWTSVVHQTLKHHTSTTCTVVGFPLGANTTHIKAAEAAQAVQHGAQEIDMVINIAALKAHQHTYVQQDIQAVVQAAKQLQKHAIVKVILETALLTDGEIVTACKLAAHAGADFVKTSTGFAAAGGATEAAVKLMRETVDKIHQEDPKLPLLKVKASGGIRTLAQMVKMIESGAERIGCSKSVEICEELKANPIPEPVYKPGAKKSREKSPEKTPVSDY